MNLHPYLEMCSLNQAHVCSDFVTRRKFDEITNHDLQESVKKDETKHNIEGYKKENMAMTARSTKKWSNEEPHQHGRLKWNPIEALAQWKAEVVEWWPSP